jgi:hypothetical protein
MNGRKFFKASEGRRPSPAFIISVIALVFAVGGGFAVAKKVSDKKSDKKIANKVVTKRAPGLSVAHAKSADTATNATNAANADKLGGLTAADFVQGKRFSTGLNEDQTTVVASSSNFDLVAVCDDDSSLSAPFNEGTALYIQEKGQDNGVAQTDDDNSDDFDIGDVAAFDFVDAGDYGAAMNPNGAFVRVIGGIVTSNGTAAGFSSDCLFDGITAFG